MRCLLFGWSHSRNTSDEIASTPTGPNTLAFIVPTPSFSACESRDKRASPATSVQGSYSLFDTHGTGTILVQDLPSITDKTCSKATPRETIWQHLAESCEPPLADPKPRALLIGSNGLKDTG